MKLFKFPVLVFDDIIKQLDPIPLVSLSFCSKKTRERIKRVSFAVKNAWFGNHIERRQGYEFVRKRGLALKVHFPQQWLYVSSQPTTTKFKKDSKNLYVRIGGIGYNCRYLMEKQAIFLGCIGYRKALVFFNYILDLVRVRINRISIDFKKMDDVKGFFSDPCFKSVQNFTLAGESVPGNKVMEFFDCFEKPILHTYVKSDIESFSPTSKLLQSENLILQTSKFMSIEHLQNFSGKYISLYDSLLFEEQIVAFIKHWLDGNYPNLVEAFISCEKELGFETDKILNEFNTKRWNPAERAQNFIFKASYFRNENNEFRTIDCSNGHDIERSDGLLATIQFGEDDSDFNFYVWHNRFPS